MDKGKLTDLIKNNYSGGKPEELIEWIESTGFEDDLNQYIEEDLLYQINRGSNGASIDLNHIIDEILTIARLQSNGLDDKTIMPELKIDNSASKPEPVNKKSIIMSVLKVAASVALIAASVFVYFDINEPADSQELSINYILKENPKGRKSTIFLKDGSKVILNSESSISYDENFSSNTREVVLEGEAFFEVAENAEKPFVVKSGEISTTALGTSFNVRNFYGEDLSVSLVTGKVKVKDLTRPADKAENVLLPGEKIKYNRTDKEFEKLRYNDSEDLLWKDGILSFKQSSIPLVFKRLERWYGVDIHVVSDNYKPVSYGGIFKDQSLEQVLEAMGFTLNFDYSIDEKKILIKFNK